MEDTTNPNPTLGTGTDPHTKRQRPSQSVSERNGQSDYRQRFDRRQSCDQIPANFLLAPDDAERAILYRALASNRGLVDLVLHGAPISDENWTIMCQSLQAHPSLTSLDLEYTTLRSPA
jgi:hypothetical protein